MFRPFSRSAPSLDVAMDQQNSMRWTETLHKEKRSKAKWQAKYLTAEEQEAEAAMEAAALAELNASSGGARRGRSERDCMEARLLGLDDELKKFNIEDPVVQPTRNQILRQQVAEQVAAVRQRSHRITGDLSTESMLRDIGPGLWVSTNPGYTVVKQLSSMHSTHFYDKDGGWGSKVDKAHHLKRDEFMMHCEKSLQLGEKVFVSGGMKLGAGK